MTIIACYGIYSKKEVGKNWLHRDLMSIVVVATYFHKGQKNLILEASLLEALQKSHVASY